jgi:hypothetical protein
VANDLHLAAGPLLVALAEPAQGRFQAEGVEHGRPQLECEAAHLLPRLLQERAAFFQPR